MSHLDQELLSAYIDGEVTADETGTIESHVGSCGQCSANLEKLRFAVSSVRSLDEPEMPELHRKQLWREINRARRAPANRWRALVAVAGTAAAIAAFAGVTMIGQGGGANIAAGDAEFQVESDNWRSEDLEGLMAPTVMSSNEIASPDGKPPRKTTDAGAPAPVESTLEDRGREENHGARIARCEDEIEPGGDAGAVALRYIVADFEGTPAYILVYEVPRDQPTHREVYVLSRSDCTVIEHRVSS